MEAARRETWNAPYPREYTTLVATVCTYSDDGVAYDGVGGGVLARRAGRSGSTSAMHELGSVATVPPQLGEVGEVSPAVAATSADSAVVASVASEARKLLLGLQELPADVTLRAKFG